MSTEARNKRTLDRKLRSQQILSLPLLIKNKSSEKTKKPSHKRQLKKCRSKQAFQTGKDSSKKSSNQSKTPKKVCSLRVLKLQFDRRKHSIFASPRNADTASKAYFPDHEPKPDKVQEVGPVLSPKSNDSARRVLAFRPSSDSERTLSRQRSKANFLENNDGLAEVFARTKRILDGYRNRCLQLEENNLKLKQELMNTKKQFHWKG